MIRLNFLPSWVQERLPDINIRSSMAPVEQHIFPIRRLGDDAVFHICPIDNWDRPIFRPIHILMSDMAWYAITIGQCAKCNVVYWDIWSCDPEELHEYVPAHEYAHRKKRK